MAGNSKNKIDLGYDIVVDVKGLNKLSADLGKLKGGEQALLHLTSLIGGLEAIAAEIKYLATSGLEDDAKRLAEQTKKVYASISTLQAPNIKEPKRKNVRQTKNMTKKEYSAKVKEAEIQYQEEVQATSKAILSGVYTLAQTLRLAKQSLSPINAEIIKAKSRIPKPTKVKVSPSGEREREEGGFVPVREESGERPSQEEFDSYAESDWRKDFQKQRERDYADQNAAWERQLKREGELARKSVMPEVWTAENKKLELENQRRTSIIKERAKALEESIRRDDEYSNRRSGSKYEDMQKDEIAKDILDEKNRNLLIAKSEAEIAKEKIKDAKDYKDLEEKIAIAKQKAQEYNEAQTEVEVLKEVIKLQKERARLSDEAVKSAAKKKAKQVAVEVAKETETRYFRSTDSRAQAIQTLEGIGENEVRGVDKARSMSGAQLEDEIQSTNRLLDTLREKIRLKEIEIKDSKYLSDIEKSGEEYKQLLLSKDTLEYNNVLYRAQLDLLKKRNTEFQAEKKAILDASAANLKKPAWDTEKVSQERLRLGLVSSIPDAQKGLDSQKQRLASFNQELNVARELVRLAKTREELDYAKNGLANAEDRVRTNQAEYDVQKRILEIMVEKKRLFDEQKAKELKAISDSVKLSRPTKGASQSAIETTANQYSSVSVMKDRKAILEQEIEANGILIRQAKEKAMLASEGSFDAEKKNYENLVKQTQSKQLELNILKQSIPVRQQKDNLLKSEADNLKKIQQVETTIKSLMSSMDRGSTQNVLLRIRQINAELSKIPKEMREATAEKFADELNDAGVNVVRVGNHLEKVKEAAETTGSGFKSVHKTIKETIKDMFSWEKIVSRVSFVLTAVSSYKIFDVFKRTLRQVIALNIEFQEEMSKTYAIMDDKSEATKKKLSEQVRELAKQYRISMKEAAEGIYEVISAQVSLKDSAMVLESAMKLAVGGFSNLKDATLALVQLLNAYDMEMERSAHVADVAFETTRLGIITTQQYADQMSKIGSTASVFGISIEEISAAISVMTRNGVRADQAFTSLNQLLLTIANPTEEAKKTMDAYGVSLDMNAVRAKGLVNALMDLGPILESEEAMTNIVKSRTGAKAMFSLVQNSGDYIDDLISMYDSEGAASEAANERLQSTASLIQQLSVALREIAIGIGEQLDPTVRAVFGFLLNSLQFVIKHAWMFRAVLKGIMLQLAITQGPKLFMFMAAGIAKAVFSLRLLVTGFKSLGVAIKTSFSSIKNFFASLPATFAAMKTGLNGVKLGAIAAGKAMATAWAEATMGLSLIITLVTQLIGWLGEAAQKSREVKIEKALGTKGIEAQISKVGNEIDILDSKIASIEGIYKMTKQADELYKSIGKDVKQTENFNKVHNKTVEALNRVLNTQIKAAEVRGKLGQFEEEMQLRYIALEEQKIRVIIERQRLEQLHSSDELIKEMSEDRPGSFFTRGLKYRPFVSDRKYSHRIEFADEWWLGNNKIDLADKWWRGMQTQMTNLGVSMQDITEKSTQASIQNAKNQIAQLERQVKGGGKKYADDKIVGSKTNKLLMQLTGWKLFLQQVEEGQLSLATSFKLPDFPEISQSVKDLGSAVGEMHDKMKDVIDKYTDLFRGFGISYDSTSIEKLRDVQDAITKMRESENNVLPDQSVIDALDSFGMFAVEFGEIGELLKKKNRSFEDVSETLNSLRKKLKKVSVEDVSKYVNMLNETGIPELQELAENLPQSIMELIETQTEQVDEYLDKEIVALMKKANTDDEKIALSTRALMLNESLYKNVIGASLDELEKIVDDERTPESTKTAIKHTIEKKRRNIANALRTMAGSYGGLLTDLEKNIGDVEDTFKYMREKITDMGGSTDLIEDMIRAFATRDVEAQNRFFQNAQAGQYKFLVEPNPESADTKFPGQTIPAVDDYLRAVESGLGEAYLRHFAQIYDGKIASPMQSFIAEMKAFIPEKINELQAERKSLTDWTMTMGGQPGFPYKTDPESIRFRELTKKRSNKTATAADEAEYQAITEKWKGISAQIEVTEKTIKFYEGLSSQLDTMIATNNISENFESFKANFEETMREMLEKSGYFKLTPQEQRKYFYKAYNQKPGDIPFADLFRKGPVTEEPIVSGGQIKDAIMSQLGLDEGLTMGDAFNIAQSKIIEVSSQAWSSYWNGRIKEAEAARDKLLKGEDAYIEKVKSQNDMMLANDNISAGQKEALAKRLEEQQRKSEERKQKIQEQYDKKAAETKKKQAKWELGISFAKAVAEIWARQLSKEGPRGLTSAAILTGFLTAMFAAQMAMIDKQSFAGGGYTGSGVGSPDSTGHKPAGIVHAGEIVFPKSVVDKNFPELMGMYSALKSGNDFNSFAMNHLLRGSRPVSTIRNSSGLYASGGLVSRQAYSRSAEPVAIDINLSGARVIDDIELHKRVEVGGKRRRYING
jgi:TP901 family phage tail tape measure protein